MKCSSYVKNLTNKLVVVHTWKTEYNTKKVKYIKTGKLSLLSKCLYATFPPLTTKSKSRNAE